MNFKSIFGGILTLGISDLNRKISKFSYCENFLPIKVFKNTDSDTPKNVGYEKQEVWDKCKRVRWIAKKLLAIRRSSITLSRKIRTLTLCGDTLIYKFLCLQTLFFQCFFFFFFIISVFYQFSFLFRNFSKFNFNSWLRLLMFSTMHRKLSSRIKFFTYHGQRVLLQEAQPKRLKVIQVGYFGTFVTVMIM